MAFGATLVALAMVASTATTASAQSSSTNDIAGLVEAVAPEGALVSPEVLPTGITASTDDVTTILPATVDGWINIESDVANEVPLSVGLPLEAQSKPARLADDNAVVYEGSDRTTDVVVHALESGDVRVQTVSRSSAAPTRYTYPIGNGVIPVLRQDGSVQLTAPTGDESIILEVGSVGAPWAFDAAGQPVKTWYEVTADSIVQVVRHDAAGVQYPVVADPEWSTGWGVYGHFNRAETATWASYGVSGMAAAGGACAAVGALGGPIVSVIVGGGCGVVAATLIHAAGIAQNSSPKKCFYVKIVAPGVTEVWAGTYSDSRCR